jgi:antitoxin component of MazEF toxin-antitoxin module
MPLVKPITKHGNSAGIILDQTILKMVGWEVGTEVEVRVSGDSVVLVRHVSALHNRRSTDTVPESAEQSEMKPSAERGTHRLLKGRFENARLKPGFK